MAIDDQPAKVTKRTAEYGKSHPTFADFRVAVQEVLDGVQTTHAEPLASLMTLNFQEFDDVSLLAAGSIGSPFIPCPCSLQGVSCRKITGSEALTP